MHAIVEDFLRERDALRGTLVDVGPDAPTACADWTTTDLAVHIAIGEAYGGVPPAPCRMLVNRGIRIDRMARANTTALRTYRRRRGFDWALQRLARRPPKAHLLAAVVPVSLLEVWAHHEDVLVANGGACCESGVDLAPLKALLLRYQRKELAQHDVQLPDAIDAAVRFLAGRADIDGVRLRI